MADKTLTREQSRGARAMLGWSQGHLADAAKIARQTVVDFERGARTPYDENLAAMRGALEKGGIEFIDSNGKGAGVRLVKSKRSK